METLYESTFKFIQFDNTTKMLLIITKKESEKMSIEEQKAEIIKSTEIIKSKRPLFVLNDHRNNKNIYSPETQEWIASTFAKALVQAGSKKFATIVPEDIFIETSLQQIAGELNKTPFDIKFFTRIDDAKKWFGI